MTKEQVVLIRNTYKGKPIIVTMGGTATFFMDNYPERCFLIWDDSNELVTCIETHREASGMCSSDFQFSVQICPYSDIESIRVLADMKDVIGILNKNKTALDKGRYEYNLEVISKKGHNTRPDIPKY